MLRRCWLVVSQTGNEAVYVHDAHERAKDYAAKVHGYVVPMMGQDAIAKQNDRPVNPVIDVLPDVPM